jgi:hypothetical protein
MASVKLHAIFEMSFRLSTKRTIWSIFMRYLFTTLEHMCFAKWSLTDMGKEKYAFHGDNLSANGVSCLERVIKVLSAAETVLILLYGVGW